MERKVFWVVTLCSIEKARRFGGTSLPYSGSNSKPSKNNQKQVASRFSIYILQCV
jgi:hypothetical protein